MFKPSKDAISRQGVQNAKYWTVTAVTDILYAMKGHEDVVFVDSVAACSVILPPVALVPFRVLTIVNKTGTSTLTVFPFMDGLVHAGAADSTIYNWSAAATSQALTNAGAFTSVFSNGENWIAVAFDLTI